MLPNTVTRGEPQRSPHELVMVHFLPLSGNARPGGKIIGFAFLLLKLFQLCVFGKECAGNLKVLSKLDREGMICPRNILEAFPI
jgi:hypothetical protein